MADKKISALTGATTPLDGTEVLPIVQSGATVKVANNDLRPKQIQSNATSGVLQIAGPAAATTRVATVPNANFTVARTDAAQTFTGNQTINGVVGVGVAPSNWSVTTAIDIGLGTAIFNPGSTGQTWFYTNAYFNGGAKYKASGEATWYQQVLGAHNFYGSAAGVNPGDPITFVQTGGLDNSGNMAVTGNFVVSTSGKGIDFSATPGTGTSELLADYEEGIWTPTFPSWTTAPTVTRASYTKFGRLVNVSALFNGGVVGIATEISGLPFTINFNSIAPAICLAGTGYDLLYGASATSSIYWNITPTASGFYQFQMTYFV